MGQDYWIEESKKMLPYLQAIALLGAEYKLVTIDGLHVNMYTDGSVAIVENEERFTSSDYGKHYCKLAKKLECEHSDIHHCTVSQFDGVRTEESITVGGHKVEVVAHFDNIYKLYAHNFISGAKHCIIYDANTKELYYTITAAEFVCDMVKGTPYGSKDDTLYQLLNNLDAAVTVDVLVTTVSPETLQRIKRELQKHVDKH